MYALEVGELAHHDRHLVGLGDARRFERHGLDDGRDPGRVGQVAGEGDQPVGLVAHGADLLVEHDPVELRRHPFEAGDLVLVERELGVLDATLEHALVAGGDLRRRRPGRRC